MLAGVVLVVGTALLLSHDAPKPAAPGIVVLATCYPNGEQLVTFRPVPPSVEVAYVDLVSPANDGTVQPPTLRSFGRVFPVRTDRETNASLHLVAVPTPLWAGSDYSLARETFSNETVSVSGNFISAGGWGLTKIGFW